MRYDIRESLEAADVALLISCFGDETGGGVFVYDGQSVQCVDRLSSTGLCIADGQIVRLLRSGDSFGWSSGELLVYDARGVRRYLRIDELADAHDIGWDGRTLVAVSTATNSILWITLDGEVVREWHGPSTGDAWHLNDLFLEQNEVYVSAFGRFDTHRGWAVPGAALESGIVFEICTGREVVTGLSYPHTPRRSDGAWLVCNSGANELLETDAGGQVRRRITLNGWTRGLAEIGDLLFVGESAGRDRHTEPSTANASLAIVSRQQWQVIERVWLPCAEIYSITLTPRGLLTGLENGFRTNALRTAEQDQLALFREIGIQPTRLWATSDPLPAESCRVHVVANPPGSLTRGDSVEVSCTVVNHGQAFLVSASPNPVYVSYRWHRFHGGTSIDDVEGSRTRLPRALAPGESVTCKLILVAPPIEGEYDLCVTLVQESVVWFDWLDTSNAYYGRVVVT